MKSKIPHILLAIYLIEVILLGIAPYNREVWLAENLTALIPVVALTILYCCKIRLSNWAYGFLALYFCIHTIGGYYTFERVPFDWITDLFGFSRNHFDRVCHFLVGTFAFAVLDFVETRQIIRPRGAAVFFAIMAIFGVAGIFEIVEWLYAEFSNPEAGAAFLGSQGDIWDAQKDMLSDGLGAMFFSTIYCLINRRKPQKAKRPAAIHQPNHQRKARLCCAAGEKMKQIISDENLRKAMVQFLEHHGLTKCTCAGCANLAVSRKTCNPYCLVERKKTRQYFTVEPIPCDTFKPGHWDLTD